MFCDQCGNPINEHAKYCRICGAKQTSVNEPVFNDNPPIPSEPSTSYVQPSDHTQSSNYTQVINVTQPQRTNATCVIGFILSFINLFFWLWGIAFIVSLVGLSRSNRRGEKGQGFAIAGILITVIPFLLGVINGIATYSG